MFVCVFRCIVFYVLLNVILCLVILLLNELYVDT